MTSVGTRSGQTRSLAAENTTTSTAAAQPEHPPKESSRPASPSRGRRIWASRGEWGPPWAVNLCALPGLISPKARTIRRCSEVSATSPYGDDKSVIFSPTGRSCRRAPGDFRVCLASGDPLAANEAYRRVGLDALDLGDGAVVEVADFSLEGRKMRGALLGALAPRLPNDAYMSSRHDRYVNSPRQASRGTTTRVRVVAGADGE